MTDVGTLDLIVAAIVVAFVLRGWARGLIREVLEIAVFFVGLFIIFRFSPLVGTVISSMANVSYEVARIVAGVLLFIVLVIGSALISRTLSAVLRVVPGATMLNRVGGSLVGAGYAGMIVVVAVTLLSIVPLSADAHAVIDDAIENSVVGRQILEPGGTIQQVISSISGQEVFSTLVAIQDVVDSRLAAGTIPLPIPEISDSELQPIQDASGEIYKSLNEVRISNGLDPLVWSVDLAVVALARSMDVYGSGQFTLPDDLAAALVAQGVPGTINTEMVVLAASNEGAVEAFTGTAPYMDAILDSRYHRSGIGVIEGPYGLMVVQILSG